MTPTPTGTQPIFGQELDTDTLLGYPPGEYPFHTLICGESGSGKSVLAEQLYSTAHDALDGPVIVIDGKDDGLPEHIIETVAARRSTATPDDVLYFDVNRHVPAANPLDIRPALAAGLQRDRAVTTVIDDYIALLQLLMGEGFDAAVRAPTILRHLLKSQFDPIHGSDVVAHDAFLALVDRVRAGGTVPEVSDSGLADRLAEIRRLEDDHREAVLGGVVTRIEHVYERFELNAMLSHTPTDDTAPQFRFEDILERDVLVIIDCGGLSDPAIHGVTTVLVQQLWRALKRRSHQLPVGDSPGNVLLGIEEAVNTVDSTLVSDLLAEGRGHGLSMVVSLQYPRQLLDDEEATDRAYRELLAEIRSVLAGQVVDDPVLAKALQSPTYPLEEVTRDLRNLPQNRWMLAAPTPFEDSRMETELIAPAPLAAGHPESPVETARYRDAIETVADRTAESLGLNPATATVDQLGEATDQPTLPAGTPQTTLWATTRLPAAVTYDPPPNAIACRTCGALYDPSFDGLRHAIECHDSFAAVDPEAIPPVDAALKLTPAELEETAVTPNQLVFLKTVLNARQQVYDPLEYDLVADSMRDLRQYTDLTTRDVEALIDRGLLVDDAVSQQKYYTPTKQARELLNEPHRRGVHHGPGVGDLNESTTHRAMVEALRRYLQATFAEAADSAVDTVVPYYQPDGIDDVLDVVGLDAAGDVVAAGEAERKNHDVNGAREDYQKMAAFDLEAALWVAPNPTQGHEAILEPLTDPRDDELAPLIDTDPYSHNTAMRDINITAPGLTDIFTIGSLRRTLEDLDVTGP